MPFYHRLGDVPRKRHIQFRENGTLLTEEVMGLEGFTGNESILYHLQSPCRVMEIGEFEPIQRDEWVPDTHQHRLMNTKGIDAEGDEISGRRLLMWNNDVEISIWPRRAASRYSGMTFRSSSSSTSRNASLSSSVKSRPLASSASTRGSLSR